MKTVNLLFSGGRTSAYLVENILLLWSLGYFPNTRFVITFANTSREHEKTLEFINACSLRWQALYGHSVIWLEAVVYGGRLPCSHKVVSYEAASRDGEVFEAVVAKYGLPNGNFFHCTRELKENPIMSFMESLGEVKGHIVKGKLVEATYETWIGIRADEPARLKGNRNGKQNKVYPLADIVSWQSCKRFFNLICDKLDVLDFWEDMPFDLGIPEHQGNCVDCHKKSAKKLNLVFNETPKTFNFTSYLDNQYSHVKPQILPNGEVKQRKRFRGYKNTRELIATFTASEFNPKNYDNESGGCSESCNGFENNEAEELDKQT
jgi:3'-phosphoadenosine 5'-phosphosulfate sulfotransferase (PAPS reductase)/FAD synthetase